MPEKWAGILGGASCPVLVLAILLGTNFAPVPTVGLPIAWLSATFFVALTLFWWHMRGRLDLGRAMLLGAIPPTMPQITFGTLRPKKVT